jgi:hypothetical protein
VNDWKEETLADLDEAESSLTKVAALVSGEPTGEQMNSIWLAYLKLEKSVVFIKVELDEENPGKFVNSSFYKVPDERQALMFAVHSLRRAKHRFAVSDLRGSLGDLRESRNYLRVLLKEKKRIKLKSARLSRSS